MAAQTYNSWTGHPLYRETRNDAILAQRLAQNESRNEAPFAPADGGMLRIAERATKNAARFLDGVAPERPRNIERDQALIAVAANLIRYGEGIQMPNVADVDAAMVLVLAAIAEASR